MREVCVNGSVDLDGAGSGSPVHKPELEKVKKTHSYNAGAIISAADVVLSRKLLGFHLESSSRLTNYLVCCVRRQN